MSSTRQILGCGSRIGKPRCPYCDDPHRFNAKRPLKRGEEMPYVGYDEFLIRFYCTKCGYEEWIHRYLLPLDEGGER